MQPTIIEACGAAGDGPDDAPTWSEAERLAALDRYAILDTGRESAFDDVAELAADLLDAPIAVVNLIAADRQWFKAEVGIGADTLPLDVSICRHAILRPGVLVVPDLMLDPRFDGNPLVHVEDGLRFYAGALLETPDGLPLGTVCVLDRQPRPDGISGRQERALRVLAAQTMARLELRRSEAIARAERARAEKHARRLSLVADASALLLAASDPEAAVRDLFALVADEFRLDVGFHYRCGDGALRLVAAAGLTPEQERAAARIEFGQTVCGIVAARREALHVTGIRGSDDEHVGFLKMLGLNTYFSAPLLAGGDLLGTVSFGRKEAPFTGGELEALRTLVAQLATALERRHAEAGVRASEAQVAGVLEGMGEGFVLLDRDFRILRINAEGVRIDGRPASEIVGRSHWDVWPGSEDAAQGRLYKRLMRDRAAGEVEVRYEWPDREGWFETRVYPVAEGLAVFFRDISDRRAVERALAESERELQRLTDALPVLVSHIDADERYRFVNATYQQWFGRHPDEIRGRTMREVLGDAAYLRLKPNIDRALSGERFAVEERLPYRDGGARDVHIEYVPRPAGDGHAEGYYALIQDVGDRVRAEAALRESEARYRTLFEAIDAGFCIVEVDLDAPGGRIDYRIVEANPAFERHTGLVGAKGRWLRAFRPDLEEHWYETYGRIARTGVAERFEQGSTALGRWFDVYAFRVGEPEDRRVAILFNDISARRNAEESLRELNETLEAQVEQRTAERDRMWETSPDLMLVIDFEGRFRRVNPAWTTLLGYSPDELVGHHVNEFVLSDDHVGTVDAYEFAAAGGRPTIVNRYRHKNGAVRWISWTAAPAGDMTYATGRDITAEKEREAELGAAQEQLRQSQKMEAMGQLTGGVAHDFNNLLTPILGSLDMLQRKGLGDERERRLIAGAAQSAERAKLLVQRLLAFARRQPLQTTAVDVAALVGGMADLVSSTTGPQIRVAVEASPDLPPAMADANQLEMALLNLGVNARDAMPDGGTLRISATAEEAPSGNALGLAAGGYLKLSVADTGSGMDEATLARAVEPFFSTKGVGKGTGLGLSMVHGLASQLGGAMRIGSRPGLGTNVELWLPVSDRPVRASDAAPRTDAAAGGRGTALLVDDEELVRLSTADMLDDLGYHVVEAASAEEALRRIEEGLHPDLLVTDHLMPGMNGTDLARNVRARRADTPVLIVSGYAENDGVAPDLPRLTKPFRKDELAASLAGLFADGLRREPPAGDHAVRPILSE